MFQGRVILMAGRRPSLLRGDRHVPESVIDLSELVAHILGIRTSAPNTVRRGRTARQGGEVLADRIPPR